MALIMFPYTNLHELNLDWIIEQLNKEGAVLSVNGKQGIVTLTGEDIKRAAASSETVAQALSTQGTNIQNVRTQIGTTALPTIAQTITGAIAENAGEIANIEDDVIGSTPLPTTAQTLTGAISELNNQLNTYTTIIPVAYSNRVNIVSSNCYKIGRWVTVYVKLHANQALSENTAITGLPVPAHRMCLQVNVSGAYAEVSTDSDDGVFVDGIDDDTDFIISGIYNTLQN